MTTPRQHLPPKSGQEITKQKDHALADQLSSKKHDHGPGHQPDRAKPRARRPRSGRSGSDSNASSGTRGG